MRKIAIFVEGYTEQQFIVKLLLSIAGRREITIEIKEQNKGSLHLTEIKGVTNPLDYYILLVNCCTDNQVKSQINKQYQSLKQSGYSKVIGLRDVFPKSHTDIPKIQRLMNVGLPNTDDIEIVLAILEIEAWFIEEHTHFTRVHPQMTLENIARLGINLRTSRAEDLPNPAELLHQIYSNWNMAYKKKSNQINRSIEALCETELYCNVSQRSTSLNTLISSLENAMFS